MLTLFILIFQVAEVHSYLGIALMAASTLQVLAGMLRPGLESSVRPVFNWGHWFMGKASHILAGEYGLILVPTWKSFFTAQSLIG